MKLLNFTGPFFEVFQLKVKVYTSKTYEDIKKGQDKFTMSTDQSVPLCGDIKVVFYNKPRLTKKKVGGGRFKPLGFFLSLIAPILCKIMNICVLFISLCSGENVSILVQHLLCWERRLQHTVSVHKWERPNHGGIKCVQEFIFNSQQG